VKIATMVVLLVIVCPAVLAIAQPSPAIRLVEPIENTYVTGPVVLRVVIDGIAPDVVADVTFFADGLQVCVVPGPRLECSWNSGPQLSQHTFSAVANLKDGSRLPSRIVRTKSAAFVERVSVDIILANAVVSDGSKFVTGLSRDAFRLFDDGKERPITSFESTDATLDVVLALDVSASMQPVLKQVKAAAIHFIKAMRSQDRLTLVVFNDRMFIPVREAANKEEAIKKIGDLESAGSTALFDVALRSLDLLARQSARHVLVLFSDGEDRSSQVDLSDVQRVVSASDVMVFGVGLAPADRKDAVRRRLEEITGASGGRVLVASKGDDLRDAFSEVVREISNQYTLGFEPRRDGRTHALKVELVGHKGKVRARQSYNIPVSPAP